MRWICLHNVPRDVKLMFRRALVGEIAIIDFHGDVTVGPPFLPRRMLKKLHHEEPTRTAVYLWPAILLNSCHIQASPSFRTCCEKCRQDSLGRNVEDHSRGLALPR